MAEVEVSQEDVKRAEALEKELSAPRAQALDVCGTWKILKPYWPWIIRACRLIPKIGAAIARALELLGNTLDSFCV